MAVVLTFTELQEARTVMVKRILIVVDDPDISTSEHYEDILAEELTDTLAERNFQLISLKIEKGSQEQEPES